MLYLTTTAGIIIVSLLAILYGLEQANRAERSERAKAQDREREQWAKERAELLNRIQRPDFTPVQIPQGEIPEQEPDDSALVGHIEYDEKYGLEDETFGNVTLDEVTSG